MLVDWGWTPAPLGTAGGAFVGVGRRRLLKKAARGSLGGLYQCEKIETTDGQRTREGAGRQRGGCQRRQRMAGWRVWCHCEGIPRFQLEDAAGAVKSHWLDWVGPVSCTVPWPWKRPEPGGQAAPPPPPPPPYLAAGKAWTGLSKELRRYRQPGLGGVARCDAFAPPSRPFSIGRYLF